MISNRSIIQNLKNFKAVARQIAQGNLGIKFSDSAVGGEFGEIAQALDDALLKLANSEKVLHGQNRLLEEKMTELRKMYEELEAQRNKAQLYLDIAGVMFAAIDEHGDITLINKKGCDILGYRDDELIGRNWFETCLPQSVVGIVKEVFAKQMAGDIKAVEFFENPIITRAGNSRLIAFHNTLLRDTNNVIRGVLFSGEDITERREAQESLEKAVYEWRAAMDASDDSICLLDLDRKILRANNAFFRLTGTTPEHAVGRAASEVLHPDYRGPCIICNAEEERRDFVTILEVDHPDNHFGRPVEVTVKMVRDNNGEPFSILVTRHDLTYDRKVQEALRESEERYRQLVELSQDIIFIQSGGKIVFINDAGAMMFGASGPAELIGKPMLDLIHQDSRRFVEDRMRMADAGLGKLPVAEVKYLKLDGSAFFGEANATSMLHHGKPAVHVFVRDITARKNLEDQLRQAQKMEAIGQLAGGVAHDFNNILTVITGYATLLESRARLEPKQKEALEQIIISSEKAAQLTKGLLAFSRKQVLEVKKVNLNDIVQHVQKFLVRIIGEDIQLKLSVKHACLNVEVDSAQIEQVLINLATNARDAMPHGGLLKIETDLRETDETMEHAHGYGKPGSYACVTMSDSGSGMEKQTMARIFEPFFTTKEIGKGTGLGMAIVYGIIKQHNGFINVYSEVGVGTTFRIYLPIAETGEGRRAEKAARSLPRGGSETILLAEDDADVRKFLTDVLTEHGYDIILAEDGQKAVDCFAANRDRISLVLMDMIMPKKNGRDAYEEISRIRPGVKVLYVSGYTADYIQNRWVSDDVIELIMKPVNTMELLGKVREILDA